ncbi:TRIC cation channel family protein [Phycicoccus sp. SLBN-51]|uniref:trimeric intracellular cation channel family protein n=1 Tax=Phycicoccus sp. SLBN-51 TaxID=2768447 RepID=UPI00115166A8|nr:TRIC cation channel family protein [Phycicoccus sp. SLBN-51]
MVTESPLLLGLDLAGTFAFALNGALTAVKVAKLDVVGVLTLGMVTALGGGIIRDILIDSLPPATFSDWRYLLVAAVGSLVAFAFSRSLSRLNAPILLLDAAGLSLFAVTGASKAMDFGVGAAQAAILGTITGVGGGTLRDMLIARVPVILRSELYAIPALVAATVVVVTERAGVYGTVAAIAAAALCFTIRVVGLRYRLNAPRPPGARHD